MVTDGDCVVSHSVRLMDKSLSYLRKSVLIQGDQLFESSGCLDLLRLLYLNGATDEGRYIEMARLDLSLIVPFTFLLIDFLNTDW